MTQRGYSDPELDSTPLPRYVEAKEAARKARRAFWRGVVIGGLLVGATFIGSAAWGGDTVNFGGTGCTMKPVSGQTHVAEVTCKNVHTSGAAISEGTMDAGGLYVHMTVFHGPGDIPDHFYAVPPDGFIAVPPSLMLAEWDGGVILIYPFVGS